MFIVFYSTNDVFETEEMLQTLDIKYEIVPTPSSDRSYCGVCIRISDNDLSKIKIKKEHKLIKE